MRFLILIALLFASRAHADWSGPAGFGPQERLMKMARENERLQNAALKIMVRRRCAAYLTLIEKTPWDRGAKREACESLALDLPKALGSRLVRFTHAEGFEAILPVVFADEIGALLNQPRVFAFLQQWQQQMDMAGLGLADADLFATALALAGSEAEALRWLGVLFQDTSPLKTLNYWLAQNRAEASPLAKAAAQLLDQVIDRMNAIWEGREKLQRPLRLYPPHVQGLDPKHLNAKLYHYYVPAHLSRRLSGFAHARSSAFFGSFAFNYLYEALEEGNPALRALAEPGRFESIDSVRDVHLGYLGSLHGIGSKEPLMPTREFFQLMKDMPIVALQRITTKFEE